MSEPADVQTGPGVADSGTSAPAVGDTFERDGTGIWAALDDAGEDIDQ